MAAQTGLLCRNPGMVIPIIMRMLDVLPAPFGPRRPNIVPASIFRLRARTATFCSYTFETRSSSTSGGIPRPLAKYEECNKATPQQGQAPSRFSVVRGIGAFAQTLATTSRSLDLGYRAIGSRKLRIEKNIREVRVATLPVAASAQPRCNGHRPGCDLRKLDQREFRDRRSHTTRRPVR